MLERNMMKSKKLFEVLRKFYGDADLWKEVEEELRRASLRARDLDFDEPFPNLIITILSQNTNARNTTRAYLNLLKEIGSITPKNVLKLSEQELSQAIRVGGLHKVKARRIRLLAQKIVEEYGGDASKLVKGDPESTRKSLLALPGVGAKTADVFLAYCMGAGEIPIDTHIARVSKRIGLVPESATYEEIKQELKKGIRKEDRVRFHELLIRFGRDICRARNPLCESCPIHSHCDWRAQAGI